MIKVGDILYYVPGYRRGLPALVTVQKVGRKWAYIDYIHDVRINIESMDADGGVYSSPGHAYASKEEYEDYIAQVNEWREFRRAIEKENRSSASIDKIRQAAALVGITLKSEEAKP